jgi:transcriptional regulator with XRE-family HTH domain
MGRLHEKQVLRLAKRMRIERMKREGVSMEEICKAMGVSRQRLHQIKSGKIPRGWLEVEREVYLQNAESIRRILEMFPITK